MTMTPEVVENVIACYTREAGVRSLDKNLAKIARARAKQIAFDEAFAPELSMKDVEKILGMPKFLKEEYEVGGMTGVVTGTFTGEEVTFTPDGIAGCLRVYVHRTAPAGGLLEPEPVANPGPEP